MPAYPSPGRYVVWTRALCLLNLTCLGIVAGHNTKAQVSPSTPQNYVLEQTPRTAQTNVSLGGSGYADVPATVSYLDGLGRLVQTVQVRGAGGAGTDIVTDAMSYDAYGRPQQKTLPVPGGTGGGLLANPVSAGQSFYGDANPYTEISYEASPLSRPTRQFGPGAAWRQANRSVGYRYGTAAGVLRFKMGSGAIFANVESQPNWDYFGSHDIATRTTTDEQNQQTIEYSDLQGRTIRRDVVLAAGDTLTTAYVYDDYERLAAVVPPKLYRWFRAGNQVLFFQQNGSDNPLFKDLCYVYLYDSRSRVIRKHVASAGWTDLVYDPLDRMVMSQDRQDAAEGRWRFIRYDDLSRVAQTGRMALTLSAEQLRTDFSDVSNPLYPTTVNPAETDRLTENFYDSYTGSAFGFVAAGAFATPWSTARGLPTRSRVRNLETNAWYESAFWYDDKGRVVQQQTQHHLGGTDRTDNQYRFNGELIQSVLRHQPAGGATTTNVTTAYEYDHWGRRTKLTHTVGNNAAVTLAQYSYDGIGRLSQKQLQPGNGSGGQPIISRNSNPPTIPTQDVAHQYVEITPENFDVNLQNNPGGLYEARINVLPQVLAYRYHLRGWLQGVNVDASGQPVLNAGRGDQFAFGLDYETEGRYDGNIGRQRWRKGNQPGQQRQYSYSYDAASRLTEASYSGASGENHSLSSLSYDANGNLLSLNRAGIDQLTYSYGAGNSLLSVSDATGNAGGFNDGNTSGDDYAYSADGSLSKDRNRGIASIQYNLLKLPRQVNLATGQSVSYQYDALGRKLRMSTSSGQVRDYVGVFQYVTPGGGSRSLLAIEHEEGRYTDNGYEYYLSDHLGNVRAVAGQSGVSQQQDYDPWGLELSGLSSGASTNRAKFNGKETLAELGSGLLDFGARGYDASIGRWSVVDPLAESSRSWSPYSFGYNNPLRFVDPDGREGVDIQQRYYSDGYSYVDAWNSSVSISTTGYVDAHGEGSKGEGPKPKPGRIPRTEQDRQQQSQEQYQQLMSRGDGITPDYPVESIFVGGALFKPVAAAAGRLFSGFLSRIFGKASSEAFIAVGQLTGKKYTSEQITQLLTGSTDDAYKVIYRGMTGSESGAGKLFLAEDASYAASYASNGYSGAASFRIPSQNFDILLKEGLIETGMGINTVTGQKGLEYVISNPVIKELFLRNTMVP